ncbi:MAG: septation protein A [Proteobacteria bacterium]|nr:septation protein A [Pseudomonadota bacterium]
MNLDTKQPTKEPKEERGPRKLYASALELAPLVLFFIANGKWGIYVGTGTFIAATAVALPCYRWLEGRWPIMPLVGGFFVLVFGGLTIWLQDETFIKLKPTIVNCLFGAILGGGLLLFKRPLLKPLFGAAFQLTDTGWAKLTLRWALFFFVLAGVNEIFWRNFSTDTWIASKMFVSFPLTLVFAFFQIPLLRRHWDGDNNPFASEPEKQAGKDPAGGAEL